MGELLDKLKVTTHFVIGMADDSFTYGRNKETVPQESAPHGIYILRTSVHADLGPVDFG